MNVLPRAAPLLVSLILAGPALAEAPLVSIRPEGRAAPEAPGQPAERPGTLGTEEAGDPLTLVVRPGGQPAAVATVPQAPQPPPLAPAPEATRDFLPAVPRRPPLIETEPPAPVLEGPRQLVRAEELMPHTLVRVTVDGWTGDPLPVRPAPEPRRAEAPAPMRPRARPLPPRDPAPLLPPEPDAPPAYAPDARPDILPVGPQYSPFAVARAILPPPRPEHVSVQAEEARAAAVRGQVCGNPLIQGKVVGPLRDGGGCGIEEPVSVRSVGGVQLSEASLMDCATAEALLDWVQEGARPAVGGRGGGIAGLDVMGHYVCRPRNNQAGARMSEHGRGRAIDIGAVILQDGSRLSVARDWPDPALRQMHDAACGPFSTTLGPGSDGFHEDHLHYDTARGRGPYCR